MAEGEDDSREAAEREAFELKCLGQT